MGIFRDTAFLKLSGRFFQITPPDYTRKISRKKIKWPPGYNPFPAQKNVLTPTAKTPNPGVLLALIFASLQYRLRLGVNGPLLDSKLLEYLHEQGSGGCQTTPRAMPFPSSKRYTIMSPIWAPIAIFLIRFSGFFKNGVPR